MAAGIVVDPLSVAVHVLVIAAAVVAFAVVAVVAVVAVQQDGVACVDLAVDAEVRDHQDLFSEEYDSPADYVFAYLVH